MAKQRKREFLCYLVEETAPCRRIKLGVFKATTATFAGRAAERKHATMMRNLECGKYHIEGTEQPVQ